MAQVTQIYPKLDKLTTVMKEQSDTSYEGLRNRDQLKFEDVNTKSKDEKGPATFKLQQFITEFDRKPLLSDYEKARKVVPKSPHDSGSNLEVMTVMAEWEFMASVQRDYMERKQSRMSMHANAVNRAYCLSLESTSPTRAGLFNKLKAFLAWAATNKDGAPGETSE